MVFIVHTCPIAGACHNLFLLWLSRGVFVFLANTFHLRVLLLSLDRRYWVSFVPYGGAGCA